MIRKILATGLAGLIALPLASCSSSESETGEDWKETEGYTTLCEGETDIPEPLAEATEDIEIPGDGHIQNASQRTNSDNPDMYDIGFMICTPVSGDELRRVAEDIAINVKASDIGDQVYTMSVRALPDDTTPETNLRDEDFQMRTHNGEGDEGSVLSAWTAQN